MLARTGNPRAKLALSIDIRAQQGGATNGLRRTIPGPIQFDDVVELLGINALLQRRPPSLSGGEHQRVAIGRALLAQPLLLLMDEPLPSLDTARKAEIMPYLTSLKTTMRQPILYVTHSLEEVAQLAGTMVLIDAGRVIGCGPFAELAARVDLPLAQRDDAAALLECRVAGHDVERETSPPRQPRKSACIASSPAWCGQIAPDPATRSVLVEIALPGGTLISRVTLDAVNRLAWRRAQMCWR
jgi:molybdate transport system ATP-binding protein